MFFVEGALSNAPFFLSPKRGEQLVYTSDEYQRRESDQTSLYLLHGKEALRCIGTPAILTQYNKDLLLGRGTCLYMEKNLTEVDEEDDKTHVINLCSLIWEMSDRKGKQLKRVDVGLIDSDILGVSFSVGVANCTEEAAYRQIKGMQEGDIVHIRPQGRKDIYGVPLIVNNQLAPVPFTQNLLRGFIERRLEEYVSPLLTKEQEFASFPFVA